MPAITGDHMTRRLLATTLKIAAFSTLSLDATPAARPASNVAHQAVGGAATFYFDQLSFEKALYDPAALAEEDFDEVPELFEGCDEPVNSKSNDHCFEPGMLIPGFDLTSTSGEGIVLIPAGFFGDNQTTSVMGAIAFADDTFLRLAPPVTAASTMVIGDLTGDATTTDTVSIEVFDADGISLGATSVTPTAIDEAAFFGVISSTPIARIVYSGDAGGAELIDTLRFGPAEQVQERVFCDGFDGSSPTCPNL